MKKPVCIALIFLTTSSTLFSHDYLDEHARDTEKIYRQECGAHDGGYSQIATSMFGWGLVITAAVALIAALVPQSKAPTNTQQCPKPVNPCKR